MITREQAEAAVGQKVVYRAPHVPQTKRGEEGVITSVNASGVFVRFGADAGSKHTLFEQLTFVGRDPRPDSVTHYLCPEAPTGMTHHLVPGGPTLSRTLRCRYCHKSEAELRLAHE